MKLYPTIRLSTWLAELLSFPGGLLIILFCAGGMTFCLVDISLGAVFGHDPRRQAEFQPLTRMVHFAFSQTG